MPLAVDIATEAEMHRLGRAVGEAAFPNLVVALAGELGVGKTRFAQGLAGALGVPPADVVSPTFVLVRHHPGGRLPLWHFDTYRLGDDPVAEFLDLGGEELFFAGGVCVFE